MTRPVIRELIWSMVSIVDKSLELQSHSLVDDSATVNQYSNVKFANIDLVNTNEDQHLRHK